MQMKNLKTNMVVLNKVNGKDYTITAVDTAKNEATLTEVLPEDAAAGTVADTITLTEANSLCFSFKEDPNPKQVPTGFSVKNGILMIGSNPATAQGQIVMKELVKAIPGKLVLLVETSDKKENRSDIMTYDPEADKFEKILNGVGDIVVKEIKEDVLLIAETRTSQVVMTDEDGEPLVDAAGNEIMGTYFDSANAHLIVGGERIASKALETLAEEMVIVEKEGYFAVFAKSTQTIDADGFVVPREKTVGVEYLSILVNDEFEDEDVTYELYKKMAYELPGSDLLTVTVDEDGSALMKSDTSIIYTNEGHAKRIVTDAAAVSSVTGYDYLVAANIRDRQFKLALANKSYDIKTVVSTMTNDRGIVVTVE